MVNAKKTGLVLLTAIMLLAVFTGISTYVSQVPIDSIPEPLLGFWGYVVTFFALAIVTTVVGFSRNILGYLAEYFKENHSEEYDLNKLGETLALYVGVITMVLSAIEPIASLVPPPYNNVVATVMAIGAATIVILDLVKKQLSALRR